MKNRPRRKVWIGLALWLAVSCMPTRSASGQSTFARSSVDLSPGDNSASLKAFQLDVVRKTSPAIRMLLSAVEAGKNSDVSVALSTRRYALFQTASGGWSADLLIQTNSPELLPALGFDVLTTIGRVAAVRGPLAGLAGLIESSAVDYVDLSRMSMPMARSSEVGIASRLSYSAGFSEDGALLGLVDTGIDFTHPDLKDSTGTRILYLWDMSDVDNTEAPTDVDSGFNWGREYTKEFIDAKPGQVIQRDGDGGGGHGTHTAGIAAGNGQIRQENEGMAPAANLIVVKAMRSADSSGGFSDADVLAACDYIFRRAEELGKPVVINLSMGRYDGPLDGSSLFEEALSELTGPGRILVAAAGNGGFDPVHVGGETIANTTYEAFLLPSQEHRAAANLWYAPGAVESIAIGYYRRQGNDLALLGVTDPIAVGQAVGVSDPAPIVAGGSTLGYVTIDALTTSDVRNGDGHVLVTLTNGDDPGIDLSTTVWSVISVSNAGGRQDMWATDALFSVEMHGASNGVQWIGDSHRTIASPSTARDVISVGSYVANNRFVDIFARERIWENPTLDGGTTVPDIGQRSYFSGLGPARDGRVLPHVSAPGEVIVSLLSSHLTPGKGYDIDAVQEGGNYFALEGTSLAAASVTGVVAGMLSAFPEMTPEQARRILQSTADVDLQSGAAPNNRFGAGKMNAALALQRAAEIAGGSAVARLDADKLSGYGPPGIPISKQFTLENTGAADLTYSISTEEPAIRAVSNKATMSTFRTAAVDRAPRPLLEVSEDGGSIGEKNKATRSSTVIMGRDVLMHDDGNHTPDKFWGMGDGSREFYWGNHYILDDFDFTLEKVQFFARTEEVTETIFWIGIYRSPYILSLFAGQLVEVTTSPEGAWYEIELKTPLTFEKGTGMFIEIAAPKAVLLPAGVDAASATMGLSYFAQIGSRYKNLNTETSSGVEKGAFLVRGVGTASRNTNLVPVASAVVSSFKGAELEEIHFDASPSSDPDGEIVSYFWEFGDGETSSEQTVTHMYVAAGDYQVTLTVTDDQGAVSEATGEIEILTSDAMSSPRLVVTPLEGVIPPGGSQVFEVRYDTEDLDNGIYSGRIEIASNAGFLNIPLSFDINLAYVANEDESVLPDRIRLEKNYPNPFNPETVIAYEVPAAYHVQLGIYDAMGRRVRLLENDRRTPGRYEVTWDATDENGVRVASGIYLYRLFAVSESSGDSRQMTGKMVLLK